MSHIYSIDGLVPVVHPDSFVHPSAVLIGDVMIGPRCYVGPGASLRGDLGRLVMEEGSNLQDNCVVHSYPGGDVVIGAGGHIGHGAVLHGCTIAADALVGMQSVVMDGAVVGRSGFVAALSFVRAGFEVPPRTMVGGIPAKIIRSLGDDEIAGKRHGTRTYRDLAARSLASLRPVSPLAEPEAGRPRFTAENIVPGGPPLRE